MASFLAETLVAMGVKRIYGIIGTSILDFVDTLYDRQKEIRYVTVRHEQVAVSMADAEYRVTGNMGAALVHAGPGFLNTMISLGIAYKDRIPLLLISGGVRRRLHGTDAWLEVDQQALAAPITKAARRLNNPEELPRILVELVKSATTPPRGPVLLEVPEDLWNKEVAGDPREIVQAMIVEERRPEPADVERVLDELAKASRPLILVCGEASAPGIEKVLGELADRLGAYIVTTGNARGSCNEEEPRCLGRVGFGGGSLPADKALEEADVVLVLGDELDDIATYGYTVYPSGDVFIVSENDVVSRRPIYYTGWIRANPRLFVEAMLATARSKGLKLDKPEWDKTIEELVRRWQYMLDEAVSRRYSGRANPAKFFKKLYERLPADFIITGGQGTHILYAYDFIRIRKPRSFLAATNLGAMGYAFPAALAAKLSKPEAEVIAVVGDGEFMMTVQDLETAVREGIPVKVIVVNDWSYRVLLLRQKIQKRGRILGTLLGNPDFVKLAEAFGAEGYVVRRDDDIDEAIKVMLESNKPFIVDLQISAEDMPPLNLEASLRMSAT